MAPRKNPYVIFNPASGRGDGAKRQGRYLELLKAAFPEMTHGVTTQPGGEIELAEKALADPSVDLIVAVGGDGTWGNVADRILHSDRRDIGFGILAAGTGNDFGRNFGLEQLSLEAAVARLARGREHSVDAGHVKTPGTHLASGLKVSGRYFINLVGCGFDVAVIEAAATARFLRGEVLYKVTALQQLFRFPGFEFELESDQVPVSGRHLMLTISNGPFFGGSFPIAPSAEINDGLLDACAIGDASPMGRMKLFGLAEKGRHVEHQKVSTRRSEAFAVRFPEPTRLEIDGDLWQAAESVVTVEAVKGALTLVG